MNDFWFYALVLTVVGFGVHIFMAALITKDILEHPLLPSSRKALWLTQALMIPFYGPSIVSRKLGFGNASGKWEHGEHMGAVGPGNPEDHSGSARSSHGDSYSGGYDSGGHGGDGGGHY